jgi:protein SCO1
MTVKRPTILVMFMSVVLVTCGPRAAQAQSKDEGITTEVGFDQNLGVELPLALPFRDESGREIRLADLFGKRPVILVPVYYGCPLLCGQVLAGLTRSLKPLSLDPGQDFDVVAFSINPEEGPALASSKKAVYLERYDRGGTEGGWHFLTGEESSIRTLSRAVGFRYTFNPRTKLYAHAAGLVVVTPDGRIARYFYGIDFPPKELELDLKQAQSGRIGARIGRLLLLCYDYDAATGKYTLSIVRLMRFLGTATAVALASFVLFLVRREKRERRQNPALNDHGNDGSGLDHSASFR